MKKIQEINKLLHNNPRTSMFLLRTVIGIIFLTHGIAKIITGIPPFASMLQNLGVPLPLIVAVLVIAVEVIGGGVLILNTAVMPASAALTILMIGALFLVHISKGWFVSSGGAEFAVLLIAGLITVAMGSRQTKQTFRK